MTYAASRGVSGAARSASVTAAGSWPASSARSSGSSSTTRSVPWPATRWVSPAVVSTSAAPASESMKSMRSAG